MRLKLFRSAWGLNIRADAARACANVRAAGFDGIEASLSDIGSSEAERRAFGRAAQGEGLELILSAYSSWVNYEGTYETKPVAAHVAGMLSDLRSCAELCQSLPLPLVRLVNAHSGTDAWAEAEARDYFEAVAAASPALGDALPPVAHETHRGRYLCCPFATARLLARVPRLRLVSDLSHWVVKTERLLDAPEEARLLRERIAPAVDHIHARLGAPQLPQLADPADPSHAHAALRFHSFWAECWSAREAAALSERGAVATATVEYGPAEHDERGCYVGYTPVDRDGSPVAGCGLHETLAVASADLRQRFESWHRDVHRRMDL